MIYPPPKDAPLGRKIHDYFWIGVFFVCLGPTMIYREIIRFFESRR